jgi:murein DD-endopeptidase MepM/ murein hydrolase activator NlpD
MTVFKENDWIRKMKVQLQDLTAKVKRPRIDKVRITRFYHWVRMNRIAIGKGAGAFTLLIGISAGGNQYITSNTYNIFHVIVEGKEIGVVNDPKVIEKAIEDKHKLVLSENPGVHMVLDETAIEYKRVKAFKGVYDNESTVKRLKPLLTARAVGVRLTIDGETVAILKDKEEASKVLEDFKEIYTVPQKQELKVTVLSATADMAPEVKELKSVEFTQDVKIEEIDINPEDIVDPDDVLQKLQSMGDPPQTYIVQEGDCTSCIAQKFNISTQELYELNSWIVDDMIRVGDEVIVKGFQPTLGVRTLEQSVEEEEIQYDTIYEQDPTLRTGKTRTILAGKNGLKRVTYELTSINGLLIKEVLMNEEVLVEPVTAVVAKGTLRLLGEGTGKFSWPVSGAKLTSSYGRRWGTLHKGIDLASSNRTIMASDTGKVVFAGTKNGYGKTVILDHNNGYQTLYAHLSKITVSEGDVLEKGEKLGVMGSTGHSTGIHLHFEVFVNGKVQNPIKFLKK